MSGPAAPARDMSGSQPEPGFRSTLVRVLVVQLVALALLGWLQVRFGR